MAEKIRVLFICLGNICRSPLAEMLFKHNIKISGWQDLFEVDSCGTGAWHQGEPADERMRSTALDKGLEITHLARQITPEDFEYFDYLLVMDHQNLSDVKALNSSAHKKIFLLTDLSDDYFSQIIPDPYFGDMKGFENVFNLLDKVTLQVATTILHQR